MKKLLSTKTSLEKIPGYAIEIAIWNEIVRQNQARGDLVQL